ncbi:MBL fold metallo-hydrolase [Patescibacteria group bacterium]
MTIAWHGQSCFHITFSRRKEEKISLVTDPFSQETGLRLPKLTADILLSSYNSNTKGVLGNPFLITGPGEYEIKGVFVRGIEGFQGKEKVTLFAIEGEDVRICFLGNLSQKELTPEQLDAIGDVDILMIPVGGGKTISAAEVSKIISQLEPKIVIPMNYHIPKLKVRLEKLDKFLKAIGAKSPETATKLTLKKKDLPPGLKVKVLKP